MENRKTGFLNYLSSLAKDPLPEKYAPDLYETATDTAAYLPKKVAALVMNANPFTLGHQYLVEKAAAENDLLHLFIVSEDASLVPFQVRKRLVMEGTAHLKNICYHDSGPYIISNATFPSYFQKDENAVIESHAMLDLTVFTQIAKILGITRRYVGEEPTSLVTGIYNQIMSEKLPEQGIECIIVPRKTCEDTPISASNVRLALQMIIRYTCKTGSTDHTGLLQKSGSRACDRADQKTTKCNSLLKTNKKATTCALY